MPRITLPDGSVKEFDKPVSAREVAESIGSRLAKAAVGAKVDGQLADLSTTLDRDCALAIVTEQTREKQPDPDALFLLRHSAAHVMAEAIQRLVPGAQLVYGPPLETGFYYDIAFPEDRPLKEGDFEAIETEMEKIVKEDRPFVRYEIPIKYGMEKLKREGSKYKIDNAKRAIDGGAKSLSWYVTGFPATVHVADRFGEQLHLAPGVVVDKMEKAPDPLAPGASTLMSYPRQLVVRDEDIIKTSMPVEDRSPGNWEDLCRGPHVPSTGRIGAFKIMSLASSYWHGDETSDRLTRVYGTAFFNKKDLEDYLHRLEEAKKRDHRVLGRQLRLFHIDDTVGQGLILWTPRGSVVRKELQNFIGAELKKQGYTEVFTPHIGSLELYKTSGHFPYYKDSQFPPIIERNALEELCNEGCSCAEMIHRVAGVSARLAAGLNERTGATTITPDRVLPDDQLIEGFMLKPMNCPHHARIFASSPHSYRDMPVRLAEFGTVYRWEQSGELNGMTRVRGFTQDDAHLFCTEEQIPGEVQGCLSLVKTIFATLGMRDYRVRVGLRDPDSNKYTGSAESWDKAEAACIAAAESLGVSFTREPGEAAFYGPKIDFVVKDVIGREWQLGTVQVDYQMGNRFDLSYIGPDNKPHRPVVIHRAPFGSMERFCGVLIEHFAGAFPLWLSPEQIRVLPISEKSLDYARSVQDKLAAAGLRSSLDDSNERVQAKIKHGSEMKVPYLLVVGPRDAENNTVSVRAFGIEKDLGAMPVDEFVTAAAEEYSNRGASTVAARFQ
ncbi:MAG: threonine--tRNA ligase [Leptolyngbya sp. PLA3]|nr:MAG: threonine--tRNA ligase [Cyanobacteria bacterium CYA]MCE7969505.1 threonine--tRNA ligase [Leptolyngbya sp. PL-A3]